eukprot:XP_019080372.1 PREDICTED: protein ACCELERATED CELL DEATH 6 [Vitis vinifera]
MEREMAADMDVEGRRNLAGPAMECLAYEAVQLGKIDFLRNGVNIFEILHQETIQRKDNLLHIAANFGQVDFAREAIRLNPGLLSQENMKGDTPLHTASRTGCLGMVEQFISSSKALCYDIERIRENAPQDLLMVNQEGDTALHVAVRYGHLDVVELLVNADIELMLHMYNKANESPLYLAVERGFFAIAKHILNKCPTCSHRGTKGMTALHAAVVRTHQGHERGNDVPHLISLESLRRFVYNIVFKVLEYLGGSVSNQTGKFLVLE